jgi:hypothetical protein
MYGCQIFDDFEAQQADHFCADILNFLSKVRRSMLSARRTCPIATDFEAAFVDVNVLRPDDQLGPYKTKPDINPSLYPTPPPEDDFHNLVTLPTSFLGLELEDGGKLKKFAHAIKGLPELPSAHTFRDTPVFPERESDTRKIRELATHEGKLGEQALRKLAGAMKLDAAHGLEAVETSFAQTTALPSRQKKEKRSRAGLDLSEKSVFDDTLRDLLADEPGGFELGPIVTSEKVYRMPDDAGVKRKARGASNGAKSSSQTGGYTAMEL